MDRRYRLRRLCWLTAIVLLLGIGGAWLRDSPVVAIKHVNIEGASGQDAEALRAALADAAHDMTTLHVRKDELETVAEPYPMVASIAVKRQFPNTLTITVESREPVAAIPIGGTRKAVAADGVILREVKYGVLPIVRVDELPAGDRVRSRDALRALAILAAAPKPLRPKIRELTFTDDGIVVTLVKGPEIRFGDASRPNAKWLAAARVLADESSAGASYIDVAFPDRPAAGGLEDPTTQGDPRSGNEAELPEGAVDPAAPVTTTSSDPDPELQ